MNRTGMGVLASIANIIAAIFMAGGAVFFFVLTIPLSEAKGLPEMLAVCFGIPVVLLVVSSVLQKSIRGAGITFMAAGCGALTVFFGLAALVISDAGSRAISASEGGFTEAVAANDFNYVAGLGAIAALFSIGAVTMFTARSRSPGR
ncbi:MAG: hypothetical protein AAF666_19075 [Pseudomonadota bacterium]